MDTSDYSFENDAIGIALTHDHCGEIVSHPNTLEEANRDAGNHDEECEG